MAKDSTKPFEGFGKKIAAKSGGAHKPDPEGGIYKSEDGATTYLIKRDIKKLQNDVAEYMAAQIFDELCPGTACTITLQKSGVTNRTFLASEFFQDNYRDLYRDLGRKGDRPVGLELAQDYLPKRAQYVRQGLAKKDSITGEFVYQNYEKTTVASLLLADQSVHSGNIGVVGPDSAKKLVMIDFGAAFRTMGSEINPVKSNMAHVVLEKNYFLRDHPKRRIFTKEFSAELKREAAIDLNPRIDKAWKEIIKNYDNEQERGAIIEFGRQIGVSDSILNLGDKAKQFPQIKDHFAKVMKQRQQSQKDMAFEIDVKLAFGKGKQDMDVDKLRAAIAENPKHAEHILKNPSETQSGIRLKKSQLKILQKELDAFKLSEIDIRKDVTKSRGYFDETLEIMKQKAVPKGLVIDFSQYEKAQGQWHEVFDQATKVLGNQNIDPQYVSKLSGAMASMRKKVNREFVGRFLEKPEHFAAQWEKVIPENGAIILNIAKEAVAFSKDLESQRLSAQEQGGQTRTTRLHNVIKSLQDAHPELKGIGDKLQKGKNEQTGQYDIELSVDIYMKLYESARKIEHGLVDPKTEAQSMRAIVNKQLPLSRRLGISSLPKTHQPIQVRTQVGLDEVSPIKPKTKNVVPASSTAEVAVVTPVVSKPEVQVSDHKQRLMAEIREAQGKPQKTPSVVFKPEKHLATIVEPRAQDTVMVSVNRGVGKGASVPSSPRVSSSGGVDPITQAIRDEVLTKQQLYLQQEIAKIIPVGERNHFLDQDLSAFRTFVQSDVGKEKLSLAMKKPETEVQLKNIESNGYKEVHSQFQDSFKKVDWVSPPSSKVRFSEIKDPDGQHITSLKETTVQGATQALLEDGSMRSIKSYRQIEFPKQIEGGNGPAHFSMAVKDENGNNVPEKGAVYFTAHYNDKGKLTEVSSPVPVKFMGKGDDAIGYIERGGKVYTLPATQGKYKEMMKEVAVNKGMGANVSQSLEVEPMAQDKMTVKVNPKIAELAKTVGKKYKKEMSEHQPKPPTTRPRSISEGMSH
jgi:hypothetical protein